MRSQEIEVNILYEELLYTFSFPSEATVKDLRRQIYNDLQLNPESQDLEFNGSNIIGDRLKLADLSSKMPILIKMESLDQRAFQFNSLTVKQKRVLQTTKNLRSPRLVYPGLTLKAKCKKQGCDAYNKEVNIKKGFGKFEMGKSLNKGQCPLCKGKTGRIYNFGYYQTNIIIQGGRKDERKQQYFLKDVADDGQFHTFKEQSGVQEWDYLDITTSILEKK